MRSILKFVVGFVCVASLATTFLLSFMWVRGEYVTDMFEQTSATRAQGLSLHHGFVDYMQMVSRDPQITFPERAWSHRQSQITEESKSLGKVKVLGQFLGFAWGSADVPGNIPADRIPPKYYFVRVPLWFPILFSFVVAFGSGFYLYRGRRARKVPEANNEIS